MTPTMCKDPAFNVDTEEKPNMVTCRLIVPDEEEHRLSYMEAIDAKLAHLSPNEFDQEASYDMSDQASVLEPEAGTSVPQQEPDSDVYSWVDNLDFPQNVKDALNELLNKNEFFFSGEHEASQELHAFPGSEQEEDAPLVHDEL
ncbi:hypothetical protein MNAN1_002316 [Malassezia nana]|uniref:Uncharacterized protein n=1 Tax=Malassezia nana TaxID=180528 RepID=A0AAF0EMQ6_9BASI|nr:hypothetical protein MNAN1_002316 [Malassezia nana]